MTTVLREWLGGGGIEQKEKRTRGHDNSVVIAGGKKVIEGLNGNKKIR